MRRTTSEDSQPGGGSRQPVAHELAGHVPAGEPDGRRAVVRPVGVLGAVALDRQAPWRPDPPPGVPVYFRNPRSKYGHIALSLGGGRIRSTDWPRAGVVGNTTIGEQERAWAISYVGGPTASPVAPSPVSSTLARRTTHGACIAVAATACRPGTPWAPSRRTSTRPGTMARLNNLSDPNRIAVGQPRG